jgi:hypothetical protein
MSKYLAAIAIAMSAVLVASARAGEPAASTVPPASASDKERIDYLIRQEQLHAEEIARLKAEVSRPKSKAELFALCMLAARNQTSAMGAESIGEHCDRIWKE